MRILPRQVGLTLVELMVTMAVMVVLAAFGIPSFQSHLKDNRRIAEINELVGAMNLARSEATKGNGRVALCASANGAICSGSTFDSGWIVFINNDADEPPAVDSGETILRSHDGVKGSGASLRASAAVASGVNFLPSGRPSVFGDFTYCDDRGAERARSVVLSLVGVIKASGEHGDGSALTCP